jgi:hypothetical protein
MKYRGSLEQKSSKTTHPLSMSTNAIEFYYRFLFSMRPVLSIVFLLLAFHSCTAWATSNDGAGLSTRSLPAAGAARPAYYIAGAVQHLPEGNFTLSAHQILSSNLRLFESYVAEAVRQHVNILVFPEGALGW